VRGIYSRCSQLHRLKGKGQKIYTQTRRKNSCEDQGDKKMEKRERIADKSKNGVAMLHTEFRRFMCVGSGVKSDW
jgi:hypothetical protein